jgi:hypothetical protein
VKCLSLACDRDADEQSTLPAGVYTPSTLLRVKSGQQGKKYLTIYFLFLFFVSLQTQLIAMKAD